MSTIDIISFGLLITTILIVGAIVLRLHKIAKDEKKHSHLRKSTYNKHLRVH